MATRHGKILRFAVTGALLGTGAIACEDPPMVNEPAPSVEPVEEVSTNEPAPIGELTEEERALDEAEAAEQQTAEVEAAAENDGSDNGEAEQVPLADQAELRPSINLPAPGQIRPIGTPRAN